MEILSRVLIFLFVCCICQMRNPCNVWLFLRGVKFFWSSNLVFFYFALYHWFSAVPHCFVHNFFFMLNKCFWKHLDCGVYNAHVLYFLVFIFWSSISNASLWLGKLCEHFQHVSALNKVSITFIITITSTITVKPFQGNLNHDVISCFRKLWALLFNTCIFFQGLFDDRSYRRTSEFSWSGKHQLDKKWTGLRTSI